MDENFFQNFWVSWDKPDNLPENWLWVEDIFDITTLMEAYRILYPKGKALEDIHYICLPVSDKPLIDFVYENAKSSNYIFIWRPSYIDKSHSKPMEIENNWADTLMILDNCDYFDDDEEEDEEYYDEEEEEEDSDE